MEWISISAIISSIVVTLVIAVGAVCCGPLHDFFKATVESIVSPNSLYEDADKLNQLLIHIGAMNSSTVIDEWIGEANEIIHQIDRLRPQEIGSSNHNDDHQSSCLLCGDACSRCNLLRKIKKVIARGEIIKRPTLRRKPVEHIRDVPDIRVGTTAEWNLKRVRGMLDDPDVWCIGLWGPGGVGKTTLVKALNNVLEGDGTFSLVRLIELKANDGNNEVKEAIAKSLRLNTGEGIEGQICNTLQREEKFLLILDNAWKSIDLQSIGIPQKWTGSKIILTTRNRRVCTQMDAKQIKIDYLKEEEAWQLFAEKVGREVVNDKEIKPLAEQVCKECGYLPLALVVVGSAMKGERDIHMWRDAVNKLRNSVPMDADIESEVYNPLKLSYDSLDDTLKSCFLYCSLYPEGYLIEINELVECWLAENLIDQQLYYTEAYSEGLSLIKRLKESCLLEEGLGVIAQSVKMHDVVRDVARRVGKSTGKSVAFSGYGISFSPIVTLPKEVETFQWISFVDNGEIKLSECQKDYTYVTTLVLDRIGHRSFMEGLVEFVKGFPAVKALNMEGVAFLDASQLHLEQLHTLILRFCSVIEEMPTANNLKILDLSNSQIGDIPRRTKELSNLKVLNLVDTRLSHVFADTISNLKFLEVLDMRDSYSWPFRNKKFEDEKLATLQEFSDLQWLREVYLQLDAADGTYEECSWMERLQSYYLAYQCAAYKIINGKIICINASVENVKVGSFILRAHILSLQRDEYYYDVLIGRFNSKLKTMERRHSDFDTSSTAIVPKYRVLSNMEVITFSDFILSRIAVFLGSHLTQLRSLNVVDCYERAFLSFGETQIVLPGLERLYMHDCFFDIAFPCGPTGIQAIAPNLKVLILEHLEWLKSLFDYESDEQWMSLEIFEVIDCPKLLRLPLMPSIKEIRGSIKWWNNVKWNSKETESFMKQRFKPLD